MFCYFYFLCRCGDKHFSRNVCHYFLLGLRTLTTSPPIKLMVFVKMHAIKCVLVLQNLFLFWRLQFQSYEYLTLMGADTLFLWSYFTDVSLTVTFIPKCVRP